ncbi:asparagine synthetase B [Granulicella sp. L60]|uniref:asparagine synthetase B family protein n=1 Tax=Granulicella sp. L60 TaxID=1641866 RepID=UPI00131AAF77|nr:asparagine synthetase B family protein [Granulicella sp. L60]
MSMQAGIWHFDHAPVDPSQILAFEQSLAQHGPDGRGEHAEDGLTLLYRAYYVTAEDSLEVQPIHSRDGNRVLWDGRLDNQEELLLALDSRSVDLPTDAELAAAAFDHWGTDCFRRLIGDWAMTVWDRRRRRLILARDYIGIRKLYYLRTPKSLFWSTNLTTLVLHSGEEFALCDEYFAGYFVSHPEPQLTPYAEIQAVPPGSYVEVDTHRLRIQRYWSFAHQRPIRYKSDAEYEEHFRYFLRQSLRHRMRTNYPIQADLSGGLDSSSIVCIAYDLINRGEANALINTLSYYSLDEPGGDERPYYEAIEAHIGKTGTHLQMSKSRLGLVPLPAERFSPLPGSFNSTLQHELRVSDATAAQSNRVHLAGLGGDELLGGVQNPVPQLATSLWTLHLPTYWEQIQAWSLQRKVPIWTLLGRSVLELMPLTVRAKLDATAEVSTWLQPEFAKRYDARERSLSAVRTWQDYLPGPNSPNSAYLTLASTLQNRPLSITGVDGRLTLPYYDRDLVAFLFAIPEEQLLRAKQRRSLMRRALKGIVPDVVLFRKTKWLGKREIALELIDSAAALESLLPKSAIGERYIDVTQVLKDIERLRQGKEAPVVLLHGVLGACYWLMQRNMPMQLANLRGVNTTPVSEKEDTQCNTRAHSHPPHIPSIG